MKRILVIGAGAIGMAILAGCGSAPTPTPVFKYQNVVAVIPKSYTGHCSMPKPPAKQAYIKASKDDRITLLLKANSALMKVIKDCDDRWDQVDLWNARQLQIYSTDPSAVFPGMTPTPTAVPSIPPQGASEVAPTK